MKITDEVVQYFRSNKPIAVIYVRGDKKEMQEMFCTLCAVEKGYKVAFATDNLDDVKDCNVLLTVNPSRLSRDQIKYYEIVNDFKKKNIKIEYAVEYDSLIDNLELARYLLK